MKRPPRRRPKGPDKSRSDAKPAPSATTAGAGRGRLVFLVGFGVILIGAAAFIRYRAESNPQLRIPPVETKDLLPTVAKELEQRQAKIVAKPDSPEAWGTYGLVLLAHDFRDQAALCFEEAEKLDDDDYRWPYYYGMTMGTTDTARSLQAFQRAVQKNPQRITLRLRLAEWLFDLRQLEECERETREALQQAPNNPRGQLLMARLRFQEGEIEESLSWAERAAQSPQGHRRDVHELLARLHMRLGNTTAADREVEQAEVLPRGVAVWDDPEMGMGGRMMRDASILNSLATMHLARGNTVQWLNMLREVVDSEPDNIRAKENLGRALVESENFDEAAKFIDETLKNHPNFSLFECLRGQVDWARGDKDKARKRFERATQLKRDYADAYLWWGRSLLTLEQYPQAIAALEEAVRLSPSLAAAYDYLGSALLADGQNAKSIDAFQHAADLKPGDLDVAMHLAQALLAAGRRNEAKRVLQTVAQNAKDPTKANQMLKTLEHASDKTGEAVE